MKPKVKPPAEPKAQLMVQVLELLQEKFPTQPDAAILLLCNYFTGADLVGIRDELQREKR